MYIKIRQFLYKKILLINVANKGDYNGSSSYFNAGRIFIKD